jgi:hypothetical protein
MLAHIHNRIETFANINFDNDYDINEQNVMKNQGDIVDITVINEQEKNDNFVLENANLTIQENVLNYHEHWKGLENVSEHLRLVVQTMNVKWIQRNEATTIFI